MQRTLFTVAFALFLTGSAALSGQQFSGLGTIGYESAIPARVAPGQIISIVVPDAEPRIAEAVLASEVPLPSTLAGFSVVIYQTATPRQVAAPILGVTPVAPHCPAAVGRDCGRAVRLDVQVPFEMTPDYPDGDVGAPQPLNEAVLVVRKRGIPYPAIPLAPRADSIHILTTCDALTSGPHPPCRPIIAHADGSLVSESAPGKPGETLVLYAYGLGVTNPAVATGDAARASGSRPAQAVSVYSEFAPFRNANVLEVPGEGALPVIPAYVGLVEGFVGLYQINFVVSQPAANTPACDHLHRPNFVLTVVGSAKTDSAAFCVESNAPPMR
ncbi:MAG: hypothetical protein IT169_13125 [Bryobacterales bacterium]|nr:hypothetical protein [Bryobacterales bacterium]